MGKFNRGGFGGGGKRFGGKPSFNNRGDREGFQKEMFKATCAECGKPCEVPFRPSNGKPVYCKDCFAKMGGGERRDSDSRPHFDGRNNNRPQRRDNFSPKPRFDNNNFNRPAPVQGNGDVLRKIDDLNVKFDRLIQAVEKLSQTQAPTVSKPAEKTEAVAAPKAPAKKVAKKKVAKKTK